MSFLNMNFTERQYRIKRKFDIVLFVNVTIG